MKILMLAAIAVGAASVAASAQDAETYVDISGAEYTTVADFKHMKELSVACARGGNGVVVLEEMSGRYCAADYTCFKRLKPAIEATCGNAGGAMSQIALSQ